MLDLDFVRAQFPGLETDWTLFDNAGGSVPLGRVCDRVQDYMRTCMVQLGASYGLSTEASRRVEAGKRAAEELFGSGEGDVVLGGSSTLLSRIAAAALRPLWSEGDEVVVTDLDHEANIGAWRELAESGIVVREWRCDPDTYALRVEDLKPLLGDRTKKVLIKQQIRLVGPICQVVDRKQLGGALDPGQRISELRFPAGVKPVMINHQPVRFLIRNSIQRMASILLPGHT